MFVQHDSLRTLSYHGAAGTTCTENGNDESGGDSLEDAALDEREHARQRLREELGREPTEGEINEWLRQQTEGY
ncbi:MAG TPA: hypothetical protein VHU19_16695 [Pyrinomonadaceae bacterium]|jgi:hypothetical protein|nr:hypothetical protein [Pyrinomonadaceae bacterium]